MRRKKIYCKIHNKRTEAQFAKQKQHRSLTIWTPDKMLRLPRRPWTARKRGENQPPANKGERKFKTERQTEEHRVKQAQGNIGYLREKARPPRRKISVIHKNSQTQPRGLYNYYEEIYGSIGNGSRRGLRRPGTCSDKPVHGCPPGTLVL